MRSGEPLSVDVIFELSDLFVPIGVTMFCCAERVYDVLGGEPVGLELDCWSRSTCTWRTLPP